MQQQIQDVMQSVHTLHAGADEELRQGLREVRDHIEALRGEGARDLAQYERALAGVQDDLRRLSRQVEDLGETAGAVPAPPDPVAASDPSHTLPPGDAGPSRPPEATVTSEPDPDAVSMKSLFTTLTHAALISTAEIRCHRHTWAFIVRHVAHLPLVHELLPEPAADDDGEGASLVTARVSGPVLMGVLNALHQTRHDRPADRLTRDHIEEIALAGALFTRISQNISRLSGPGEGSASRTQIVFDDRQVPTAPGMPAPLPGRPDDAEEPEDAEEPGDGEQTPPVPDAQPKAPPPTLYRISGRIWRVSHPLYCVARTTSAERCRNPLEYGQTGVWTTIPAASGTDVHVYDVGDDPRWLSQHCSLHDDSATEDYCPPQWQPYDTETDQ